METGISYSGHTVVGQSWGGGAGKGASLSPAFPDPGQTPEVAGGRDPRLNFNFPGHLRVTAAQG